MKEKKHRPWLRSVLFTLGGAVVGLAYYLTVGCASGTCVFTSHPLVSMAYMGLVGYLLGRGLSGCCCSGDKCDT